MPFSSVTERVADALKISIHSVIIIKSKNGEGGNSNKNAQNNAYCTKVNN